MRATTAKLALTAALFLALALVLVLTWPTADGPDRPVLAVGEPTPICGPGSHWIDTCVVGSVRIFTESTIDLDLDLDDIADVSIELEGSASNSKSAPMKKDPMDALHANHLDSVISALSETSGEIVVHAGTDFGLPASIGAITEQAGNSALADSSFDVFFEISGTPFGTLHNEQALHLEAVIDRILPFGTTYTDPSLSGAPLPLLDGSNVLRAQITAVAHSLVIKPVGGIALDPDLSALALEAGESSGLGAGAVAGIAAAIAAGAIALGGAGWYARRRWLG